MNLALYLEPSGQWLAGLVVQMDLLVALQQLGPERPHITLVIPAPRATDDYVPLQPLVDQTVIDRDHRLVTLEQAQRPPAPGRLSRLKRRLLKRRPPAPPPHALPALLRQHDIDCMFSGAGRQQTTPALPCVTWIYDFQHLHLPDLFTPEQRQQRSVLFKATARAATLIMVTSEAVRQDFAAFAPALAHKARAIEWVSHIPPEVYQQPTTDVLSPYHLPEKFFYLPNQFWLHKNHALVWDALRLLAERGVRPTLVCTGLIGDERAPRHASDLFQQLSLWNLREQVIFLGAAPREHVFALMRQCVRVINPSLFEGLGLAVAECKSLGKSALLSDLPVLREQALPGAEYFDPRDPWALAALLEAHWLSGVPGPDARLEAGARQALPARQAAFGRAFAAMLQDAARLWRDAGAAGSAQR